MSNGCASLVPPTPQQEMNQEQHTENVADGNTNGDCFGWALYYSGQALAN
jgi:hypothetical protein